MTEAAAAEVPLPEPAASANAGPRDLVVIGASAGGVETLRRVVSDLPGDLAATVCIVLHIAPDSPSLLANILARAGALPVRTAGSGERLRRGEILVAPPDRHLMIADDHTRLSVGPRENGHRPAVDALFRSAAEARGRNVIGVVLSGTRGDGTIGLAAVKANGGGTIVQDPAEALYAGMPANALAHVAVDAVVPSELVAATIAAMVKGEDPPPAARQIHPQPGPALDEPAPNDPAVMICPDCGGSSPSALRREYLSGSAGSGIAIRRPVWSTLRLTTSNRRCGWQSARWRTAPAYSAAWPTTPSPEG